MMKYDILAALTSATAELAAELAASKRDGERLDWLCRRWESQFNGPQSFTIPTMENPTGSFRDAIDAAMSKEKPYDAARHEEATT
jgi:hypothetical protein